MKPAPFRYHDPTTVGEITALLAEHGDDCKLLAGGQSLVPMLSLRLARFPHIVDINRADELTSIEDHGSSVSIGAVVRQRAVEHSSVVRERLPLLAHATGFIGHFQIRNRGTIGGAIAHADPAAEYPAVAVALQARLELTSAGGSRTVDAEDFFQGLWTTSIEPDELLTKVEFPVPTGTVTTGFSEVARRPGDFATAGAAVQLEWDGDRITGGRLAIFGVGTRPELRTADQLGLVGVTAMSADLDAAAASATAELEPTTDIHGSAAYRRTLAGVVTRRAIESAVSERKV